MRKVREETAESGKSKPWYGSGMAMVCSREQKRERREEKPVWNVRKMGENSVIPRREEKRREKKRKEENRRDQKKSRNITPRGVLAQCAMISFSIKSLEMSEFGCDSQDRIG